MNKEPADAWQDDQSGRYVALLRGINVGGHRVTMADLRTCFTDLGFVDVRSYIQTGNVFFRSPEIDRDALRRRIEGHLEQALGWQAPTCLRTVEELEAVLALDPFAGIELTAERRFAVTFFPEPHGIDAPLPHRTPNGGYELVAATRSELFVVWHLHEGRPAKDYTALGRYSTELGTTRFWHTTAKILAAAKKAGS